MGDWFRNNRDRYPDDWNEIALAVKQAAGWTCQGCGAEHGPAPYVLTVDHVVDHDPSNVDPSNLAALCQRCHLRRHGMRPAPRTVEEALRRLGERVRLERAQLGLPGFDS